MSTLNGLWPVCAFFLLTSPALSADYCDSEVRTVTPGTLGAAASMTAPSDAIVLFDGKDLSQWRGVNGPANWEVHDGVMTVRKGTGDIHTEQLFQDIQLHIEWRIPPGITGEGQERGNSGVYIQGRYEIQILDSYQNRTYANGQAGAVYGQTPPLVNAMRKPGEWNVYDVIYNAPRFNDDGTVFSPAHVTVIHNGVLVQNNSEIRGNTGGSRLGPPAYEFHGKGPIRLQDAGGNQPISFRNIWVRELGVLPAQPAPAAQDARRPREELTVDSPIGELLRNPVTHEVLSRCLPALAPEPSFVELIGKATLRQLQPHLMGLGDAKLNVIDRELARAQAMAGNAK